MADVLVDVVRHGTLGGLEASLKQHGSSVNRLSRSQTTALHAAVWRNHIPILKRLLEASADLDAQDGESGWSALHRALYWGNLQAAACLLEAGARISLADWQGRTPLDLLSRELKVFLRPGSCGDVYSWGNGANYQLGTGSTSLQLTPVRLDALHEARIVQLSASKFNSAALSADGTLYTWGFGRGGRLGHADFDIHSGESAVILPQPLVGFGRRRVAVVATAKHHTVAATTDGELFTWGSNREGRLGYPAVDTQPTPRRVTTLRQRVLAVAAANRHSAAVTEGGCVYTWGSNTEGQLGYGTSDSASNALPRLVEAVKGKQLVAVAAAKRHTVVLTSDGDVYTWGHRVVTPRRVQLSGSRDTLRTEKGWEVVFHKGQSEMTRPHAISIAAGAAHTCCLTRTGAVVAWRSTDNTLTAREVGGPLGGKKVVSISAGKDRTAVVTDEGDIFIWEGSSRRMSRSESFDALDRSKAKGKQRSDALVPERVDGAKRVVLVAVGEKHSLALQSWCSAPLPHEQLSSPGRVSEAAEREADDMWGAAADAVAQQMLSGRPKAALWTSPPSTHQEWGDMGDGMEWVPGPPVGMGALSLQKVCERAVAQHVVEPRTALQILEYADAVGLQQLRHHCTAVSLSNLDAVLMEARHAFEQLPPHLLLELEQLYKTRLSVTQPAAVPAATTSEPLLAGQQHLLLGSRPSAAAESLGSDEGMSSSDGGQHDGSRLRIAARAALNAIASSVHPEQPPPKHERSFKDEREVIEAAAAGKHMRTIRKKLQQIEALEQRLAEGASLDTQQTGKVAQKAQLLLSLEALEAGAALPLVHDLLQERASPTTSKAKQLDQHPLTPEPLLQTGSPATTSGFKVVAKERKRRGRNGPASQQGVGHPPSEPQPTPTPAPETEVSLLSVASDTPGSSMSTPGWGGLSAEGSRGEGSVSGLSPPTPEQSTTTRLQTGFSWAHRAAPAQQSSPGARSDSPSALSSSGGRRRGQQRKGGLSMFLKGYLEKPSPPPPAPPAPTLEPLPAPAVAWGVQGPPVSLRAIQSEEAALVTPEPKAKRAPRMPGLSPGPSQSSEVQEQLRVMSLAQFMKSSPMQVKGKEPEKPPAWGGVAGSSPPAAGLTFKDIQAHQQQQRDSVSRSWGHSSPTQGSSIFGHMSTWQTPSPGAAASSPGSLFPAGTSPTGGRRSFATLAPSPQENKWYIPEERKVVPLRAIQTEETAIKELSKLYGVGNVRLVKSDDRHIGTAPGH